MPDEPLPPRPRRRLLTPASGAFAAIVLAGAGFIGGVQVQKRQDDGGGTGPAAAAAGGPPGFAAGGGGGGGGRGRGQLPGGGGGATRGEVKSKRGSTLYVESGDGTTVEVRTDDDAKVIRTAAASVRGIYPGDTVVVQGKAAASGTVTASQIIATSASAGDGLAGLLGGGPPPQGGAPSGAPGGG